MTPELHLIITHINQTLLNGISSAVDGGIDSADSIVIVRIEDDIQKPVAGATVSLSGTDADTYSMIASPPTLTDTTDGSNREVVFFNVPPGSHTVGVTAPGSWNCSRLTHLANPFTSYANSTTTISYRCHQ